MSQTCHLGLPERPLRLQEDALTQRSLDSGQFERNFVYDSFVLGEALRANAIYCLLDLRTCQTTCKRDLRVRVEWIRGVNGRQRGQDRDLALLGGKSRLMNYRIGYFEERIDQFWGVAV